MDITKRPMWKRKKLSRMRMVENGIRLSKRMVNGGAVNYRISKS